MSALANALLGRGIGAGDLGMANLQNLFNPDGYVGGDLGGFNTYSGATEGLGLQISPNMGTTPVGLVEEPGIYEPGLDVATDYTPMDIATDIATDIGLTDTPVGLPIIGGTNIETGSTTPVGGDIDLSELFANLGGGFNPNAPQGGGALPFGAISVNAGPAATSIPFSGFYDPRQYPVYANEAFGAQPILSTSLLGQV